MARRVTRRVDPTEAGSLTAPARAFAPVLEKTNPCAVCTSAETRPLHRVDGALIVSCSECGLVRQQMRPVTPATLYASEYYATDDPKGGYANYFLDAAVNRRTFRRRIHAIERRYGRRGRLLDVGCALGDFVLEAEAAGWEAEGVEISEFAAAQARGRGARVQAGKLEELALPSGSFDVVTLYDTVEHLTDPVATLREAHRLLVTGGLVHLVTPNVGGLQARVFGSRWYHYKPGEHLYYFSPSTLQRAIELAGMRWNGWARSGSYVTLTYLVDRLRYYADRPFAAVERLGRALRLGPFSFYLYVGEMEAWARREDPTRP